jgi:2-methylcitrate dehydratase PrpD
VDAQFSIQYCVANALLRRSSKLIHFEADYVKDPAIADLTKRINVAVDKGLETRGHTPLDMRVKTRSGKEYLRGLDIAPGFPGNALTRQDHKQRFKDCFDFAGKPIAEEAARKIVSLVDSMETLEDIRVLVPLLVARD